MVLRAARVYIYIYIHTHTHIYIHIIHIHTPVQEFCKAWCCELLIALCVVLDVAIGISDLSAEQPCVMRNNILYYIIIYIYIII